MATAVAAEATGDVDTALEEMLDAVNGENSGDTDTLGAAMTSSHFTAISPPPPPPTLQLPLGLTASAVGDSVYLNHHLSVSDLRPHLEQTLGAGRPPSPGDRALLDCLLAVAVAAAIDSVQDIAYGAPELRNKAPIWTAALICTVVKRPS